MTDNEIIQVFKEKVDFLSSVTSVYLDEDEGLALYQAAHSALDLINRQQAEIERLRYNLEAVLNERADHSEAIKDFAERFLKIVHDNHYLLVDFINSKDYGMFTIGIEQAVDETKKEMVGEE